ncbi:MAG: nuclear transport factor 2 family protein [Acidimicrobiia bacterium]|nr:nuclear transport factor 2 family protein [Acidimicrobiia bacterium]
MTKARKVSIVAALVAVVAAGVYVQQAGAKEGVTQLTALDHAEIRNMYAMYNHYVDSGKDEGRAYANLYTPDGIFHINLQTKRTVRGHDALAELARGAGSPPPVLKAAHHAVNVMIEPTAAGANGSAYLIMISSPTLGTSTTGLSAMYFDKLVKTADGWKFKERRVELVTPRDAATSSRASAN